MRVCALGLAPTRYDLDHTDPVTMSQTSKHRRRKQSVAGQVIGESQAERAFQQELTKWVQGRAEYDDVVRAIPENQSDAMVWLGRKVRGVFRNLHSIAW